MQHLGSVDRCTGKQTPGEEECVNLNENCIRPVSCLAKPLVKHSFLFHFLSSPLTQTQTDRHTHTHTHSLSLSLSHTHTHISTHRNTPLIPLSHSLTHTHSLSLTPTHTHTHTISLLQAIELTIGRHTALSWTVCHICPSCCFTVKV